MVVYELLRWKAPACLILAVILLCFNTRVPQNLNVGFAEFFAGEGQISLALWSSGVRGSSHDIRYTALMDLCTPSGFATFGCMYIKVSGLTSTAWWDTLTRFASGWQSTKCGTPLLGHLWCLAYVATASARCVLASTVYELSVHVSIQSAILRSYHTAGRDVWNEYRGNDGYSFVRIGNLLASRLILLLILCVCRGCRFLIEQPEGSTLSDTPRFQWFLSLTKVACRWIWGFRCCCKIIPEYVDC